MTEKKPCYEDPEYVNDCLEDGNRKCCHLGPPKNGSWADCNYGRLSPYHQPPAKIKKPCFKTLNVNECDRAGCFSSTWETCYLGKLNERYHPPEAPPSEVQPMLADAGQWTDRLLALLERIATAQEKEVEAWVALKDSEKKRVEYARNAEAIRQHSIDKEAAAWAERNAFLDARVDAQHQAWVQAEKSRMEWNARAAERGEREIAAIERIVGLLEYLCDRKRDLE